MSYTRKIFWWAYGIQAVIVFPGILGEIGRGELPFWPWHSQHADAWTAAIDAYWHLIFYSVFYMLPYQILQAAYKDDVPLNTTLLFIPISLWVLGTVMLFHTPIFDFVAEVFDGETPAWYQWLQILWVASTVCIIIFWRAISRDKIALRVGATSFL